MRKVVDLPLHGGHAPRWLFKRMSKLAGLIIDYICLEFGSSTALNYLADPVWFQAFSCVLGFDWHSSGTTTVTMAAVKNGATEIQVAGGKGQAHKTLSEIESKADLLNVNADKLVIASRLSAKVDSALVQDGYSLYHHTIAFNDSGDWTVVQQGMNDEYARRYHWFNETAFEDPHSGVIGVLNKDTLDLTNSDNIWFQHAVFDVLDMPKSHWFDTRTYKKVLDIYEHGVSEFRDLVLFKGAGAKTFRALAMVSEVLYNKKLVHKDPIKYSFAHGGKDGIPYPVNKSVYDNTISTLSQVVDDLRIEQKEKRNALRRLSSWASNGALGEVRDN